MTIEFFVFADSQLLRDWKCSAPKERLIIKPICRNIDCGLWINWLLLRISLSKTYELIFIAFRVVFVGLCATFTGCWRTLESCKKNRCVIIILILILFNEFTHSIHLPLPLQIFALCVDLVVTSFICPAIVNPESYGIIDTPVSYIARFNLIQVAKILQMLAMRKYEPVDPKVADLYKHFDEDCLSSIINVLLEDALQKNQLDKEPSILDNNDQLKQMTRNTTAFFTEQQLHNLVSIFNLYFSSTMFGYLYGFSSKQTDDVHLVCFLKSVV